MAGRLSAAGPGRAEAGQVSAGAARAAAAATAATARGRTKSKWAAVHAGVKGRCVVIGHMVWHPSVRSRKKADGHCTIERVNSIHA